jgi:signal transduction histidine kinase
MGLPYNVFMTSALVIVALVGIVTWSLLAISRRVDVNRGIATQSLPTLRMGTSLGEQPGGLTRTEMDARPAAGEPSQKAWNDRAARMAKDFDLLRSLLGTQMERSQHQETIPSFAIYRRHAWNTVFWALLASLAAALATTAFLAVHLTRSLRRLSIATAQRADGAFTHPLPVASRDEIGELARSFNRRAERLREADPLEEEFFLHISHGLRTPLASAKEATHPLLERVQGPLTAKQRRLVDIIAARSDRLLQLAIVKGCVEAHGGRVRVESEEGRESGFLVRLPRHGALPVGPAPTGSER